MAFSLSHLPTNRPSIPQKVIAVVYSSVEHSEILQMLKLHYQFLRMIRGVQIHISSSFECPAFTLQHLCSINVTHLYYFVNLFSFQTRCEVLEDKNHIFCGGVKENVPSLKSDGLGPTNSLCGLSQITGPCLD